MKYIFISFVLLFSMVSYAENINIDITKLSPEELKAYQSMVAKQSDIVTPDSISKYSEIGKAFGEAFKSCWGYGVNGR